jgi:hypothetical protein
MNVVFLIASVVLPLLPVVLFPTRFIGRGRVSTLLGAGMIVGMMMLIYFGLQGFGDMTGKSDGGDDAVALSDADMSALKTLF